jgi:type VI secretion system protein ImpH
METMGPDERPPVGALVQGLIAKPQGYNLFQAISLLEREAEAASMAPQKQGDATRLPVRLSSVVSLGFQASDVSKVSENSTNEERFTLHTAVLSLAGANGPLPLPFTEMLLERTAARDYATADFLDIFNHRFLAFLYRSRKKHHMGLNGLAPQSSPLAACLDALSALGLGAGVRAPNGDAGWLEHAGLLGGAPRSATGLLAMLSHRLEVRATARQFCGGWRRLESEDTLRLDSRGRGPRLGRAAVLGRRVWDQSAGICIMFHAMPLKRLEQLLKGGRDHALMNWLVRRYLPQDLDVDIVLQVRSEELEPSVLGGQRPMRLGWTSWLVSQSKHRDDIPPARFSLTEPVGAAW